MVSPVGDLLSRWGIPSLAGGFAVAALAFMLSVVCCVVLPRRTSTAIGEAVTSNTAAERRLPNDQTARLSPMLLTVLTTMVVSQIVLASIQTMTPVHAVASGVELREVGLIMSAHIVGMYAFTPVAGWIVDRMGSLWVIIVGLTMMAAASVIAGAVAADAVAPLAVSLFILGVGWSFGFVAASSVLTHETSFDIRTRLQGQADTWVFAGATAAILGSGVVVSTAGFRTLCLVVTSLVAVPAVAIARNMHMPVRVTRVPVHADGSGNRK
jgi:MFS family permease